MASRTARPVNLSRLSQLIADGEYYEAHQLYRSAFARHVKQGHFTEAIEVALHGALELNSHRQHASAADLALLLVDAYDEAEVPLDTTSKGRVIRIFEGFPATEPTRVKFMRAALRWSWTWGPIKTGDLDFRHLFGLSFWSENKHDLAAKEFLYGTEESAKSWAQMLFEGSLSQPAESAGLIIVRPVLQYLCLSNLRDAAVVFEYYSQLWLRKDASVRTPQSTTVPAGETRPGMASNTYMRSTLTVFTWSVPLFNFAQLLLLTAQRNSPQLFARLRSRYGSALAEDPVLPQLLDRVGVTFGFMAEPRQDGLFGGLLESMFGGGGGAEEGPGGGMGGMGGLLGLLANRPSRTRPQLS